MAQSPFERAVSAGLSALRAVHGVSAACSRGDDTYSDVTVIPGESRKGVISDTGSEAVVQLQDFLIDVADYPWPEPQVGDTITREINGQNVTFTVEYMENGQAAWDWSDTYRTRWRITTRLDGDSAYEVTKPNGFDLAGNEIRHDDD